MTRYTRANGAKASNVRTPNDPTPWHVMKQQLEANNSRNQEPPERVKTAKELLADKQDLFYYDTTGNADNWAEFEAPQKSQKKRINDDGVSNKQKRKLRTATSKTTDKNMDKLHINESTNATTSISDKQSGKSQRKRKSEEVENDSIIKQKTKKHKKEKTGEVEMSGQPKIKKKENVVINKSDVQDETETIQIKKSKKKKKMSKTADTQENNATEIVDGEGTVANDTDKKRKETDDHSVEKKLTKRQKRNSKRTGQKIDGENNKDDRRQDLQSNNRFANKFNGPNNNFNQFDGRKPQRPSKNNHRTPAKVRDDKEHKRRKPAAVPQKLMINGIEVEVAMFGGFPVKKEDAERLKDLKQQMIMKGIPKKDMEAALKLERRRAEKALTRIKKEVCYHCRKAGHLLSDCPELGRDSGTGICFKCGSTEHTHFECKVARATEFRFAKCFICREQGHIAKQCPDNPKGVYPQGGACKICGDVTHLKKDCPDLVKEKEESTITLDTIENSTIESLEVNKTSTDTVQKATKSKIVKF